MTWTIAHDKIISNTTAADEGDWSSMQERAPLLSLVLDDKRINRIGRRLKNALVNRSQQLRLYSQQATQSQDWLWLNNIKRLYMLGPKKYWPRSVGRSELYGKILVRQMANRCLKCFKFTWNSSNWWETYQQILYQFRTKACLSTSPIICLPTKVVHLGLVADLITSAFPGPLRRVRGRYRKCPHIYSDNETFVVARWQEEKL